MIAVVNRQCAHCIHKELEHGADGGCWTCAADCSGFTQSEFSDEPSALPKPTPKRCVCCGGEGWIECIECDGTGVAE